MPVLLQIALGGAIGAVCRHLMGVHVSRLAGSGFPWGTLAVNVLGSFIMGLAVMVLIRRADASLNHLAPFVMTGILGGFTTFSAFSLETMLLIERGRPGLALAYVAGSVAFGVGAFAAGLWLLRRWAGL
jgi:CrcB protein